MKMFYTNSAKHIAGKIGMEGGKFTIKRFSDDEIYIKIEEDVEKKEVWVIASTISPGDNIIELMFLLDALKREKARISLLLLYFGYARQDRIKKGEAFTSNVICGWLNRFRLNRIFVVHMHSTRIKKFMEYKNILPLGPFYPIVSQKDVIAAPDKGAYELARKFSIKCKMPAVFMKKYRPEHDVPEIIGLTGNVKNKRVVIVDDMISTGGTVVEAAKKLLEAGANQAIVIATHGIFSGNAIRSIEKSQIDSVYVSNTIPSSIVSRKIHVLDVSNILEEFIFSVNSTASHAKEAVLLAGR